MTVELRHVVKSYDQVTVLKDISLQVQDGEFVSLLGPSGCGKTTLLNAVAGLTDLSGGEIIVDGQVWSKAGFTRPPERRNIGMVFQDYALWPHVNVFDNVAFGLKIKGWAKAEIRDRVESVLETVDMVPFRDGNIHELSGGQKQRVAIARALATSPRLMLMDEPLSSLDAKLRERMRWDLLEIIHEAGLTTLYVTHDQTEALSMSDRVVLLQGGRIEQTGKPETLYETPQTAFVAEFVGASNLLECQVIDVEDDSAVLRFQGQTFQATRSHRDDRNESDTRHLDCGQFASAMVRPHAFEVTKTGSYEVSRWSTATPEAAAAWRGTVRQRSYHGALWQYRVELAAESPRQSTTVLEVWSRRRLTIGDTCIVTLDPGVAHVLEKSADRVAASS